MRRDLQFSSYNNTFLLGWFWTFSLNIPDIIHINRVRYVDNTMVYWTTEQIFSRQTILESYDSALVEISLVSLIPSQKKS